MAEKNRIWQVGGNTFLIAIVSAERGREEDLYKDIWSNDQHQDRQTNKQTQPPM